MTGVTQQLRFADLALDEADARQNRFAELVERQSRFVFRVAYAITRNPSDAEDVVQETFLKIFRTAAWERIEDERAFLARTAWRIAVDRRPRAREALDTPDLTAAPNPEQTAIAADRHAAVH